MLFARSTHAQCGIEEYSSTGCVDMSVLFRYTVVVWTLAQSESRCSMRYNC